MDDGIKLALSVDFKVNLGNYESATVFVCLSGVPVGATEEDIEDYMDTAGLAWEVIRDRVRAQAESLKNRDEPPAVSPARKASPSPTRPAADAKVYSEDEMRELSKWARGIDMDKEAYQAIQIKHGAAWPAALDRAREAGCSSLSQLIDFCISGVQPSAVPEYDPFNDPAAVADAAKAVDDVELLKVFRLTASETRKIEAAVKRMGVDLAEVAATVKEKAYEPLMRAIDPEWLPAEKATAGAA